MSDEDLKATLEAMKKLTDELVGSPEKTRAFLVDAGLINPEGGLH